MGRAKQTLSINGHPLLLHVVDHALSSSANEVVVVLGSSADTHLALLETYPVHTVVNDRWEDGIGSSIKSGLKTLLRAAPYTDAVLFMVSDQPLITHEYIGRIVDAYAKTKAPIVASSYNGTVGVPALFARSEFDNILSIEDNQGAKLLITQNMSRVLITECPDAALDLDTPEDYENFKRIYVNAQ